MQHGLEQDAENKCLLTIVQGVNIGQEMQAKNIILIHRSQRSLTNQLWMKLRMFHTREEDNAVHWDPNSSINVITSVTIVIHYDSSNHHVLSITFAHVKLIDPSTKRDINVTCQ